MSKKNKGGLLAGLERTLRRRALKRPDADKAQPAQSDAPVMPILGFNAEEAEKPNE